MGKYTISLTATLDSYQEVQATATFFVYLLELKTGPGYLASKDLQVYAGPYSTAASCITTPDFGFTLTKDMLTSAGSLPTYVTYNAADASVVADPQDENLVGSTFSVTF